MAEAAPMVVLSAVARLDVARRAPRPTEPVEVTGSVLATVGVTTPLLDPTQAVAFETRATDRTARS